MNPKLEDLLFLNKPCKHQVDYENSYFSQKNYSLINNHCTEVKLNQETLENLIKAELKEKCYSEYVKYFKSNEQDCTLKAVKSSQKSIKARIEGNALLARKKHDVDVHGEIWKLYSKSIALASVGSKELVLAYECRSNLLLHFKKYEDCIKDIDRALSITEFDLLKVKLLARKMTCFVALNKDIYEKQQLWTILKYHLEKIDDAFKDEKFSKMIKQAKDAVLMKPDKKVKDKQKFFTSLTSLANITLTNNKERCIVANRDYGVGEAVIVTKPLIASVNPNKFYAYCSYCLSFMWAGIPCDECSLCMYCSEECKNKAWEKYHVFECKVNPHINFNHSIYYQFSNSIKIFFMGVREFGSISKLLEKVQEVEQGDPKLMKGDQFFDSEFLNFYTLSNITVAEYCSFSCCVKNTCFLMAYLTQILNDIFEKNVENMTGKGLAKDADFVHSAFVMLKMMMLCELHMNYPCGKRLPKCTKYDSIDQCTLNRCCPVGMIFYFFNGLIEKSCNSNVAICNTDDGEIVYYCNQPIKKMQIITLLRNVPFFQCDKEERMFMIPSIQSLCDVCKCVACVKDWPPVLKELKKYGSKYVRRSGKVQTKGTELVEKYRHKQRKLNIDYEELCEHKCSIVCNIDEFQELARDTNDVVNTCGQPSFASSYMIILFRHAFHYLYGSDFSINSYLPKEC